MMSKINELLYMLEARGAQIQLTNQDANIIKELYRLNLKYGYTIEKLDTLMSTYLDRPKGRFRKYATGANGTYEKWYNENLSSIKALDKPFYSSPKFNEMVSNLTKSSIPNLLLKEIRRLHLNGYRPQQISGILKDSNVVEIFKLKSLPSITAITHIGNAYPDYEDKIINVTKDDKPYIDLVINKRRLGKYNKTNIDQDIAMEMIKLKEKHDLSIREVFEIFRSEFPYLKLTDVESRLQSIKKIKDFSIDFDKSYFESDSIKSKLNDVVNSRLKYKPQMYPMELKDYVIKLYDLDTPYLDIIKNVMNKFPDYHLSFGLVNSIIQKSI